MRLAGWILAAVAARLWIVGLLSSAALGGSMGMLALPEDKLDAGAGRLLQTSSTTAEDLGDTVIHGVLELLTTEARDACTVSCKDGLAAAFGVDSGDVNCLCPTEEDGGNTSDEGRRLFEMAPGATVSDLLSAASGHLHQQEQAVVRRRLRGLAVLEESVGAAFALRVGGGLDGGVGALDLLASSGSGAVASAFGVEESELEFSTLTVTPPASDEPLNNIVQYADAGDVGIVPLLDDGGADWAGGTKGAALFFSLLILWIGTLCCCLLLLGLAWKSKWDPNKKIPHSFPRKSVTNEARPGELQDSGSDSDVGSPSSVPLVDPKSASSSATSVRSKTAAPYSGGVDAAQESSSVGGGASMGSSVVSTPHRVGRAATRSVGEGEGSTTSGAADSNLNASVEESRGTNPLYKSVAPLSRQAAQKDIGAQHTPQETPGRTRLGFLGNATPARLRKLAGRIANRSPAMSGGSRRSRRSSRSSSSSKSHRRQGTFPGAYSQRNSSEMDHQRPPADPVYTFMIKTIAAKGFKFMSTTEIAFCAMRMYSHFKRTEGNYKRLAVMKHAENVPPVYEIIWLCDANSDQLAHGQSRFFSSSRGTDAEQQKSLLACLLALSWNGSNSSRRTLQRALTPARPARVPDQEDIFWDDFKDNTDALSGDDQMVVLARVVLLIAESINKPYQDSSSESSTKKAGALTSASPNRVEANGIEHGDVMKALSGAHLREVGISIKASRPGWQEAHVQLVSVLLIIAFLEEGAKNAPPGGDRPDPLSSLEWVGILTPEALDSFLVEKLEARRALVELDLEPSGLVIKHDDEGEVERVEPALGDKKSNNGSWIGSRGHQKILPRSSDRKSARSKRSHRRSRSTEGTESSSSKKSHSPVKITTVMSRKTSTDSRAPSSARSASVDRPGSAAVSSSQSQVSTPSSSKTGLSGASAAAAAVGTAGGLRTIAQQRNTPSSRATSKTPTSGKGSLLAAAPSPSNTGGGGDSDGRSGAPLKLTINPEEFAARVPATGGSVRSNLSRGMSPAGSEYQKSETSSVVTRVYAPSSCTAEDQVAFSRAGASWGMDASSQGQRSPMNSVMDSNLGSPANGVAMSQISIAASRVVTSPTGALTRLQRPSIGSIATGVSIGTAAASTFAGAAVLNDDASVGTASDQPPVNSIPQGYSQDLTGVEIRLQRTPSGISEAARSDAMYSEAASRYEAMPADVAATGGAGLSAAGAAGGGRHAPARLGIEPPTPNSAAGSRFEGSPSSQATSMSRIAGSPTAEGGDSGPYTTRSMASSMRSGGSSFFKGGSARSDKSGVSGESRGRISSASGSSWDEDDLQNMGTRWLSERAYNQQFDDQK